TPTRPACDRCPLENQCRARAAGEERELPITANRKKPRAVPVAFALIEAKGRVLLVRREPGTLLGGLWGLPGGEVPSRASERTSLPMLVKKQTGFVIQVGPRWSPVDRTFSHRKWSGSIYRCSPTRGPSRGERVRWILLAEALQLPLVPFHREALESLSGLESFALLCIIRLLRSIKPVRTNPYGIAIVRPWVRRFLVVGHRAPTCPGFPLAGLARSA